MTFNDFIINSRSKGIDKFLKSEPNPPIQIGDCVKVVANTFQDEIINTKK